MTLFRTLARTAFLHLLAAGAIAARAEITVTLTSLPEAQPGAVQIREAWPGELVQLSLKVYGAVRDPGCTWEFFCNGVPTTKCFINQDSEGLFYVIAPSASKTDHCDYLIRATSKEDHNRHGATTIRVPKWTGKRAKPRPRAAPLPVVADVGPVPPEHKASGLHPASSWRPALEANWSKKCEEVREHFRNFPEKALPEGPRAWFSKHITLCRNNQLSPERKAALEVNPQFKAALEVVPQSMKNENNHLPAGLGDEDAPTASGQTLAMPGTVPAPPLRAAAPAVPIDTIGVIPGKRLIRRLDLVPGADFSHATFLADPELGLQDLPFRATILHRADLSHTDCRGADFSWVDLRTTRLHGAQLAGAWFQNALILSMDAARLTALGADLTSAWLADSDGPAPLWQSQRDAYCFGVQAPRPGALQASPAGPAALAEDKSA
jgi:hypothetical protein